MSLALPLRPSALAASLALLLAPGASFFACGGSNDVQPKVPESPKAVDDDALALLPSGAIAVGELDVQAFFANDSLGPELARLAAARSPIGPEAGFDATKDVDRVTFAAYSTTGADALGVARGRFNAQKIDDAAKNHAQLKGGGTLIASEYGGRSVYTVSNVGFVVLSPKTALVGSEGAIRRALDRIKDGKTGRAMPAWMTDTLETPGAALTVTVDFANHPEATTVFSQYGVSGSEGLKAVRLVANFASPGMHVASTSTYDTDEHAAAGGRAMQGGVDSAGRLGSLGLVPRLREVDVHADKSDLKASLTVDDGAMRALFAMAKPFLP